MEGSSDIPTQFKFPKKERLHSKILIDALFKKGASFHLSPFTVKFLTNPHESADCHQVLISVPKKKFKRAVDRNRIKRLVKEAYRLNKPNFLGKRINGQYLLIAYIYNSVEILPYSFVEEKLKRTLERLIKSSVDKKTSL